MIKIIKDLPDNVVGIVAKGRVTNEECANILRPVMEDSLKHDKVRLYYEIGSRFPGAAWEDLRIGIEHVPQWERVAVPAAGLEQQDPRAGILAEPVRQGAAGRAGPDDDVVVRDGRHSRSIERNAAKGNRSLAVAG